MKDFRSGKNISRICLEICNHDKHTEEIINDELDLKLKSLQRRSIWRSTEKMKIEPKKLETRNTSWSMKDKENYTTFFFNYARLCIKTQ